MIRKIIKLISVCVIIVSASVLAWQAYTDYKIDKTDKEAKLRSEQLLAQKKPTPLPTYSPVPTIAPTAAPAATRTPVPSPAPTLTPIPSPALSPTPAPKAIQPEFRALREEYNNDDIVGYLKIPGTSIDYPVTHSGDNTYYLENDINKNASIAGWIFMDGENNIEKDDPNIVIYGHNMRKDIMFHSLRYYQSWDYFNEHRYIIFNTIYENYVWEVFSFYRAEIDFPYIQVVFQSDGAFNKLAAEMKKRSMYDTGVEIKPGDHILTLSTCTNEAENTRFALNARRLSPDEIPEGLLGDIT